ncbi:[protein-PII] uridylyltransferase [Carbonactinospora thermoautotrophica]|uniref:[protein-PII] uridylyltransferase n=1 Tax=Carbonactinospora thermoautotrophica TaxID=1469144 RepID=UPI0008338314|nr:[protein-PII] uridylyltransferase [Carbonactinospora thermoautotrophica]
MLSSPADHFQYGTEREQLLARPDLDGPGRRRALADAADRWLAELLGDASGVAIVAVGGYGRRELSPGSDLDVVLVHDNRADIAEQAERIWYPIWDSGVRLDHAVRTVAEVRRVAAQDLKAQLGLLDARHVAGDAELTRTLRSAVLSDWRAFAHRRLPELLAYGRERAQRFGELAFLIEPDLKEARGGLRDVQALRAVAASWLADPPHGPLEAAYQRLLDVRDALHRVTGRSSDRLLLQDHDAVAEALGLHGGDALLRTVAEAARTIAYASDTTWRQVERVLEARRRRVPWQARRIGPTRLPLAEGVVAQGGEVVLARDAQPRHDPVLLLRAAAAAAQAGLPLSPHAVERLAEESAPLPVPWPAPARDALISLLGAGEACVPVWEALDQAGLIVRLLPDWERVRCRPQRNPVHRFTVDRHLVETAVQAAALTRRVARPDLLLVGALLHDIGKGWPGDHLATGEAIVRDLAPALGFDAADTDVLARLVRHHLLLMHTATRRDLDDPATVDAVVKAVGSVEVLELLHALTEADALATGPTVWTAWRRGLVEELVARTYSALHGRPVPAAPALSPAQRALARNGEFAVTLEPQAHTATLTVVAPDRVGLLALVAGVLSLHRLQVHAATTETVGDVAVQVWQVIPAYGSLPDVAALREDVRRALDGHLDVAGRLARREAAYAPRQGVRVPPPRVDVLPAASESATVVEVRAHDGPALLHKIGQVLADVGVDVRRARVATLGAEAVDVFYVVDEAGEKLDPELSALVKKRILAALR